MKRATAVVAAMVIAFAARPAAALITGGEGNEAIRDPGWPQGAAEIFNHPGRVAYWEGPPFGGGQWHAECRGDAEAFNKVLEKFAALDVKTKRLAVHDGVGHSFWLNPNQADDKKAAAEIDWTLAVWQPDSWERLRELPPSINPTNARDAAAGPPATLDVYVGGRIRWSDVVVPPGLEVTDNRLEAHGFAPADGTVLQGKVVDASNQAPIAARVRLQLVEPSPQGGYNYTNALETATDETGAWSLKNVPEGWYRVVADAEGYAPRSVGYGKFDDQPRWHYYGTSLARPATVAGRVVDEAGQPLAEATVRIDGVVIDGGERYDSPKEYEATTDKEGRFAIDWTPAGKGTAWVHKPGYVRPGLGPDIELPTSDLEFTMSESALVRVTVDFAAAARPDDYIVSITPEGGNKVGSWGGSASINAEGQAVFEDVPPGRYQLTGKPNPSREGDETAPIEIDLDGGAVREVTLPAK
jgi:hypothetical protein